MGSLAIDPSIRGEAHWLNDDAVPLTVGDVNPDGTFMHVLDDATLDVLLNEFDTITDFTSYLSRKEVFVRSGVLQFAGGDEDLAAYYMKTMNEVGEHAFSKPDGTAFEAHEHMGIEPGLYPNLVRHPQYIAKKQADEVSYLWDRLIDAFASTVLDGTALVPEGQPDAVEYTERALRYMALVTRFRRRLMGDGIAEVLRDSPRHDRFTRSFLPGSTEPDQETGFFFMTFSTPKVTLPGGYDQYRRARLNALETYAYALLEKQPTLRRVVGIAREPLVRKGVGMSEDIILLEDVVWTDQLKARLADLKKLFNIMSEGNFTERAAQGKEFPDVFIRSAPRSYGNRKERRREKTAAKRKAKKR